MKFYESLYEQVPDSPILASTLVLLAKAIEGSADHIHSQKSFQETFSSVNMEIVDYKEVYIQTQALYQQNIWKLVANGFVTDADLVIN